MLADKYKHTYMTLPTIWEAKHSGINYEINDFNRLTGTGIYTESEEADENKKRSYVRIWTREPAYKDTVYSCSYEPQKLFNNVNVIGIENYHNMQIAVTPQIVNPEKSNIAVKRIGGHGYLTVNGELAYWPQYLEHDEGVVHRWEQQRRLRPELNQTGEITTFSQPIMPYNHIAYIGGYKQLVKYQGIDKSVYKSQYVDGRNYVFFRKYENYSSKPYYQLVECLPIEATDLFNGNIQIQIPLFGCAIDRAGEYLKILDKKNHLEVETTALGRFMNSTILPEIIKSPILNHSREIVEEYRQETQQDMSNYLKKSTFVGASNMVNKNNQIDHNNQINQ